MLLVSAYVGRSTASASLVVVLSDIVMSLQWAFLKLHILRVRRVKMAILNNMSSLIKPGRATLVLGPPGAGKSTLLKAMAGKLSPHGLKVVLPLLMPFPPFFAAQRAQSRCFLEG